MAAGTLYTYPENFRAYKALVAAQYASANVKVATNFVFGETNKTADFLKKFPSGKVPAFETSDGKCFLNDSNAIAFYVANNQLRGGNDYEKAQILQWISFADNDVLQAAVPWVFPVMGIVQYNKQTFEKAKDDMKAIMNVLNTHLATRTYLVGERITLADISVACTLLHLYSKVMDPAYRKPYAHVNRWFLTIVNQPQFKAVNGEPQLCDKAVEVDSKKSQSHSSHGAALTNHTENNKTNNTTNESKSSKKKKSKGKDKKEKEHKKEEKKEKEKKSTPKKEKEAEPVEEMDAAEAALAAEPKSKDPFESLPKGTFNMDDYKRCYSNEDEAVSIPYFWEKFDPENYSIWFGEYKYNDELSKVFMSCNLITGMFQRLDKMRKQAFASVCLFGEDNNSSISGLWVWRGHELAFTLSPDWQIDYEVYEWKKLDAKSEDTKKLVAQYFSWSGTDSKGRKFNQGKIFK